MNKNFNGIKQKLTMNRKLTLRAVAVCIVIVTVLVIASCLKKTDNNIYANNFNSSIATKSGKWIYYIDVNDGQTVGISRIKTNGKHKEKIADGIVSELNIVGNEIFGIEYDERNLQYNLIKMKTNGKNKEVLVSDIDEKEIFTVKKWVYYFKDETMYRVKTNGSNVENITDKNVLCCQNVGNSLYYIYKNDNAEYIAKMNLNGEKNERIAKAEDEEHFQALYVKGGKIYFIISKQNENYDYEYYLYKMNKNGEKKQKICNLDNGVQFINMQDDKIYYSITENYSEYTLKSIRYDGTSHKTITKDTLITNVNVIDEWIFFSGMNGEYDKTLKMINVNGEKKKEL